MFALVVHFTIFSLASANIGIKHDANVDIVQLQNELHRQGDLVDILLKRLDAQDTIIAKQAERITILEDRENNLDVYLSTKEMKEGNDTIKYDDKRKTSSNRELEQQRRLARPQIRQLQGTPIAFHATVNAANDVAHIGMGEKIIFDNVKISIGGGYHSQHGLFIAPRAGLYLFSISIMSSYPRSVHAELLKNGVTLAGAFSQSFNYFDQGSVSVVTQLSVGDEVYVANTYPDDTSFHTHDLTSFMGCLITEM